MQCTTAKARIDQLLLEAETRAPGTELNAHLAGCDSCRAYAQDVQLDALLRRMPVPPMSENFRQRALDKAWAVTHPQEASKPSNTGWWVASAASVVLAASILFSAPWRDAPQSLAPAMQVVQVMPQEVRQVELLMVSGTALPNATITISMDANVALAGYPNTQRLSWQVAINQGNNQLTLPVQVHSGSGGEIVVEVESDGAHKQMRFAVATGSQENLLSMTI